MEGLLGLLSVLLDHHSAKNQIKNTRDYTYLHSSCIFYKLAFEFAIDL